MKNKHLNIFFFLISVLYMQAIWSSAGDGYAQEEDVGTIFGLPVLQDFEPSFLKRQSPLKIFDLSQPDIAEIKLGGELSKKSVTDFFINFAQEKGYFNPDLKVSDIPNCLEVNIPKIESYFASFIAQIKINDYRAKDKENNHWFLKEISNNNIAEFENLWFLNKHKKIFSRMPIDNKYINS